MGIRFYCPNGHKLNVKAFLAGKRGICPHCDARFDIPFESVIPENAPKIRPSGTAVAAAEGSDTPAGGVVTAESPSSSPTSPVTESLGQAAEAGLAFPGGDSIVPEEPVDEPESIGTAAQESSPASTDASSVDPIAEVPDAVWYVRPPSGGQYGPARGDVMRGWIGEGRVSADSLVWREGWSDWKTAGPIFPTLENSVPELVAAAEPAESSSMEGESISRSGASRTAKARPTGRRKSVAAIVFLGLVIVVLLVVLVVVLQFS